MKSKSERLSEILGLSPVVAVLQFTDVDQAVLTSRALVAGGLPVIEITMRTAQALDCIAAVARQVEGAIVGAGTALTPQTFNAAVDAGSQFVVSPGVTQPLMDANRKSDIPLLPGVATPSEAMGLLVEGYEYLKFFPAEQAGGKDYLKAMSAVFPDVRFCPTGGLNAEKAPDYLALDNVICVGGSWVAPAGLIESGDWDGISEIASAAAALG